MSHFSLSSEDIEQLSESTLMSFMKHVLVETKKLEDRKKAREALDKHLVKIKKEVKSNKVKKDTLNNHLVELENKIRDLLEKESKLLRSQEYENKTITELRTQVQKLEEQVMEKESEKQNLMRINSENIQAMQYSINSLRQQLSKYINDTTGRERRMQELENKIKLKIEYHKEDDNEKKIKQLEEKYMNLKRRGVASQAMLDKIMERINMLKTSS